MLEEEFKEEEFDLEELKAQHPEFSKKFSDEYLSLAFSEEIFSKIAEICLLNEIAEEEKITETAHCVGLVLFGGLNPGDLQEVLAKKLNLSFFKAGEIVQEINKSIFPLFRKELNKLYEKDTPFEVEELLESKTKPVKFTIGELLGLKPLPKIKSKPKKEKPLSKKFDIYQEPIE